MVINEALNYYFSCNGDISLDEAFLGEKHKKTTSLAYKKHKMFKYQYFASLARMERRKSGNEKLSLEDLMFKLIQETDPNAMKSLGFDPDIDIETFMRGYRRWKKELGDGKYE